MAVALYVRVSTEEQAKEGYSISAQRKKLKAYCVAQDWDDYRFYVDEGISAKDMKRPQLQLMQQHIEEGLINTVLVYRLDRLTRSVRDLYKLLETFDKFKCAFRSATEVYDTSTAMGRMFITIVAALAQWESENLAERVKLGQYEKAMQGLWSAPAPFGWKNVNRKLVKVSDQQEVLQDIIDRVFRGQSIRQIANYLNASQTPTIRGYQWHIATILNLLHNPALFGSMRWGDMIIEDSHEGILSKEDFEKLQVILHDRQNFKKRDVQSIFIYQMRLKCPTCGNFLTSERSVYHRKRDDQLVERNYYRCQPCTLNGRKTTSVSEKKMNEALVQYMKQVRLDARSLFQEKKPDPSFDKWRAELAQIDRRRAKYQQAWASDFMTDDEFHSRMKETKTAKEDLENRLQDVNAPDTRKVDLKDIEEIALIFEENWYEISEQERRDFVSQYIRHIEFVKREGRPIIVNIEFY